MAKLSFFIGKGGVGKTTVSAAYAVHLSTRQPDKSVLLLSTDPAHSLADILQQPLADKPRRLQGPALGKLFALQVDSERRFANFLAENRADLLTVLEQGSIFSREDLEPLLDVSLPGIAEISALLAIHEAVKSRRYDYIVVDTAPFGHTLRLFGLPQQFLNFVDFLEFAASRDRVLAAHFGGTGTSRTENLVAGWRRMGDDLSHFARDADLILVTTAETLALNESARVVKALSEQESPLEISSIVLNRAVTGKTTCKRCQAAGRATVAALRFLKRRFPGHNVVFGEDSGAPIFGSAGLQAFGAHVFAGRKLDWRPVPAEVPQLKLKPATWPTLNNPLTLIVGKGGVGKTTISAALGFNTRQKRRRPVDICSVDPAPSLDDIFDIEVGDKPRPVLGDRNFRASEMDSVGIFQSWARELKDLIDHATRAKRGSVHIDLSFERQLFSQLLDSVPPGIDEVVAVFRVLELLRGRSHRVVIDMAPTGHALELLRTPSRILAWTRLLLKTLAAHRTLAVAQDAAVKVAQLGAQVRELVQVLGNRKRAEIAVVMLAEPMPDRETERLISQLSEISFSAQKIFVNRIVPLTKRTPCLRCRAASQWQTATLAQLTKRFAGQEILLVRNFSQEITGKKALQRFTGELWRLA